MEVRLTGSPERQTLVVLANARRQVNALGAAYGEQKEAVMSRLKLPAKADHTPDLTNGMPMWGELPNKAVGEGFSPSSAPEEVTMIRSVVKVTLKATNPPITHGFDEVHVYNLRTGGRVSPDNYDNVQSKVSAPTVPAGATVAAGNHINTGISYFMTPNQESFYLFESDSKSKVTGTSALAATCLVVRIKSTEILGGGYGYYRIDFKDYTTGAYLDLLRNHDYRIEVESIEGLPAGTADEAYKGNHTLKCKIVPWNQVNEEVVVPGNKRLSVDKRVFQFPGDPNVAGETGGTQTLTLSTENTGGWRIDGKPDWVNLSQTSGADGTPATVTLSVGVNPGRTDRTAVMNLVAGNLTYKIHLSQPDACGKNGVPKKMRIGNNDYYTHRFGGQCWMLENSREGTPDHILNPLPGRPHRRYLWYAENALQRAKYGAPSDWDIPTYRDVYLLKKDTYPGGMTTGTSRWLWLQWQQDPGVIGYYPVFDMNGPYVDPWPGRSPSKFYSGAYPGNWVYRRLPRLSSYTQKQHDNINAFWAYEINTNSSMDSGRQVITAADGRRATAFMRAIPITTVDYWYTPANPLIEVNNKGADIISNTELKSKALEWATLYWWVNPTTGDNWPYGEGPWAGLIGLLRPRTSSRGWFGPYDMPWRIDDATFKREMIRTIWDFDVIKAFNHPDSHYKTKESGGKHEYEFYPYLKELYNPYLTPSGGHWGYLDPSLPQSNVGYNREYMSGLTCYWENLLPLRFVRRD
ncbi:BACON domain-containing protein [Bacteroides sp. 260]|uniref:BACON domain-containing protein n=1 Tax=Bacteroides sp. 260 TaxID=3157347 RepID=UPI004062E4C1